MKQAVLELCLLGLFSCFLQCIVPQGSMKKTAMFACSLVMLSFFLQLGVQTAANFDGRLWSQEPAAVQTFAPSNVYAAQIVETILGTPVECRLQCDEDGLVESICIVIPNDDAVQLQLLTKKQSITRALCGIYGIDECAISFAEGG